MTDIADLAAILDARRPTLATYVVGLTGSVAAGKSTLAAALVSLWPGAPRVEVASTDGFLHSNAALAVAGLLEQKGFPESYDSAALSEALEQVRRGAVEFPGYSHQTYDVDPSLARTIDSPDVLILEGLGFSAVTPVDALVYLDAAEEDLETWFTSRFLRFWEGGLNDPTSFYARFRELDREGAVRVAAAVWRRTNLPNLREHILPLRQTADLVVRKTADHGIARIQPRGQRTGVRAGEPSCLSRV